MTKQIRRGVGRPVSDEVKAAILLVESGLSPNSAAGEVGISVRTVRKALARRRRTYWWEVVARAQSGETRTLTVRGHVISGALKQAQSMTLYEIIAVRRTGEAPAASRTPPGHRDTTIPTPVGP